MKRIMFYGKSYWVHDDTMEPVEICFRQLDFLEECKFRAWAEQHVTEKIKGIYHPVVQDRMYELQSERETIVQRRGR